MARKLAQGLGTDKQTSLPITTTLACDAGSGPEASRTPEGIPDEFDPDTLVAP